MKKTKKKAARKKLYRVEVEFKMDIEHDIRANNPREALEAFYDRLYLDGEVLSEKVTKLKTVRHG